jgi:hypothetical protein
MITKYNMTSGELTYQNKQESRAASEPKPHELANLITSLQLIEIEVRPESKTIPADLLSISAADFIRRQG